MEGKMVKKLTQVLWLMIFFFCTMGTSFASGWVYNFYRHAGEDEVIYSAGGGTLSSYMTVSAIIKSDNTVSVRAIRSGTQTFPTGTLFLLKDSWGIVQNGSQMLDPDNVQASESVDNESKKTLTSKQNLDDMMANWSGDDRGGVMNMYLLYENETDYAWIGPITIQRTPPPASSLLSVNISPAAAITDGAAWRVVEDNSRWYNSGETIDEALFAGSYSVQFKDLSIYGWKFRPNISVDLLDQSNQTITVVYHKNDRASIQVITYPSEVGGQWHVWLTEQNQYSEWYNCGEVMPDIVPGDTIVEFRNVPGWITPQKVNVLITSNETVVTEGTYCKEKPDPPSNVRVSQGLFLNKILVRWTKPVCDLKVEIMRGTTNDPLNTETTKLLVTDLTTDYYIDEDVLPGVMYYYWIRAYHEFSAHGESELSQFARGFVQLASPSGIQASDCSKNDTEKIRVQFSETPGAIIYEIWRANVNNPGMAAYIGKTNDTFYDDTSCIYEKSYYYWIKAVNPNLDTKSELSSLYGRGCRKMPAVTGVRAEDGVDCEKVVVTFEPVPDGDRHNIKYQLIIPDNNTRTSRTAKTINSLVDNSSVAGEAIFYKVKAYNEYGYSLSAPDSGWKKMASVSNLSTTVPNSPGTVHLEWNKVEDAKGYIILRGTSIDIADAVRIGTVISLEYFDNTAGREYRYWVKAYNEFTESISPLPVTGHPQFCEYSISPSTISINEDGGTGVVNVIKNFDVCEWVVTNTLHWVTFEKDPYIGSSKLNFTINPTTSDRQGSVIIGGDGLAPYNTDQKQLILEQYVTYALSIDGSGNGKVKINGTLYDLPFEQDFDSNEEVSIQAIPGVSNDPCIFNAFDSWTGTNNTLPAIKIVMNQDQHLRANFIEMTTLNVLIEDSGVVKVNANRIENDASFDFPISETVSLLATPAVGSEFLGWRLNDNQTLVETEQMSLMLTQCNSVAAVFDSGWELDIISERGDSTPKVTIGVKAEADYSDNPPLPPEYETMIEINQYLNGDNYSKGGRDIRAKTNDPYYETHLWGLTIDSHGNQGPPTATTATVYWNSDQIDDNYVCQVLEGYDGKGDILISNMTDISEFKVTGTSQQFFTIRCRKIPERPAIIIEGMENPGVSRVNVVIDTDTEAQTASSAPPPPEYSCDLTIIPVSDWENINPDWDTHDKMSIYSQGLDSYQWLIAANPKGNIGGPMDATSTIRWNFTNFNEGNIGFWKLIEGYDPDGTVLIHDMTQKTEMTVTGGNVYQYYIIEWSRFLEIDLIEGWNLISVPIISDNMSVKTLFPDAQAVYAFENGGYQQVDAIVPGVGYWVKNSIAKTYQLYGSPFSGYTRKLESGWHLMGTIMGTTQPATNPENAISSIFQYDRGSYTFVETLTQGSGYWIKMAETADLTVGTGISR